MEAKLLPLPVKCLCGINCMGTSSHYKHSNLVLTGAFATSHLPPVPPTPCYTVLKLLPT